MRRRVSGPWCSVAGTEAWACTLPGPDAPSQAAGLAGPACFVAHPERSGPKADTHPFQGGGPWRPGLQLLGAQPLAWRTQSVVYSPHLVTSLQTVYTLTSDSLRGSAPRGCSPPTRPHLEPAAVHSRPSQAVLLVGMVRSPSASTAPDRETRPLGSSDWGKFSGCSGGMIYEVWRLAWD